MSLSSHNRGFSLVELAIVLVIVALLSGGLMMAVSAQMETIASSETQRRLNDARDALLGYVAANGRLPCPAIGGATGVESPLGGGSCNDNWDGFLPAVTLGISPTNETGYALDGWSNPIRYAITKAVSSQVSTANQIRAAWNAGGPLAADLQICSTAVGITGSGAGAGCAAGSALANNAVAVIYSRGRNGAAAPASTDEQANGNADRLFVSHTPTPAGANEFDDLVIWLSPNILYNRLIAAGRLP
ncbi:type II secretion system protein [Ferribacterium limneticum]|uniref:type II secretion system protein n=1 Tax=Ferribacterium limneticum TaxID=76259 RepID=UPI001CFB2E8C|nr:type II secretion system protein [Ferribacterium limneticum]UCV29232.1 type II secretion system protein [Ferribacterium limneticum]UCV33151.1 type II secretion system protein [Ferribacterium limneticum]